MNDKINRRNDKKNITDVNVMGRHYQLSPKQPSLAIESTGQPYVDRSAMSARAVISTSTIDRVGDVLIPMGCQLSNYQKNPVVLWAHGMEGIVQPIGTSRSPEGQLAITITEDEVQATSWFAQSSIEAVQIFELIDEGVVKATSVRETPIKSHVHRDPEAGDLLIVDEWDLEEWSWCAVGINPDAVAKALHRNRLGGRPIIPSIRKSLTSVAPTLRRLGVGLPEENQVTSKIQPNGEAEEQSIDDTLDSWDQEETDVENQPYGATVVSAAHLSLTAACQNISEALGPLENPDVKIGLQAILTLLKEQMSALEGLHLSNYPDLPELKSDDEEGGQDEESMKSFLASGQLASLQVLGLGARLRGLAAARNVTPIQRRTLTSVSQQLNKLVSLSKSQMVDNETAKLTSLESSIRELQSLMTNLKRR